MTRHRVLIRFRKEGDLRLISHRDLLRAWERLFRRAGVALRMSAGFHPRPHLNFPSALALGTVGLDEALECELADPLEPDEVARRLAEHSVPGLVVTSVVPLPAVGPKVRAERGTYELPIPPARRAALAASIAELWAASTRLVTREGRDAPLDLRAGLDELALEEGILRLRLRLDGEVTPRPREVFETLGVVDLVDEGETLTRSRVELTHAEERP